MDEYYTYSVGGPALTDALRAASTEFPEIDPNRDSAAHQQAGGIASNLLHAAAEQERGFDLSGPTPDAMKRDLASVMSYYYEDLDAALVERPGEASLDARDWTERDQDSVFGFRYGASIRLDDATTLLDTIWEDEVSKERVLGAATVHAEENIQHKIDNWTDLGFDNPEQARNAGYKDYGAGLGRLMGAAHEGELDRAEQAAAIKDLSKGALSVGVAAAGPLGAGVSVGAAALDQLAGTSIDQVGGGPEDAREAYAAEVDDATAASRATVTEMMLRRGDWPPEDLPPEYRDYWDAESQRLRVPEDPQERGEFRFWQNKYTDGHIKQPHN